MILSLGRVQILQFGSTVICICLFTMGICFIYDINKILVLFASFLMRGIYSATLGAGFWLYTA
jgi:hypothetical protein